MKFENLIILCRKTEKKAMFQWKRVLYRYGETLEQAKSANNPLLYLSYLCRCSFMWWVLVGSVLGLAASSLMIVYWFSRLRSALAEKGWKYTSTLRNSA